MAGIEKLGQMYDMTSAGVNPSDTPEMRAGLRRLGVSILSNRDNTILSPPPKLEDDKSFRRYALNQADEDTRSLEIKRRLFTKRSAGIELTPQELVQEAFVNVRNPTSKF
jgi:hypothetical protein